MSVLAKLSMRNRALIALVTVVVLVRFGRRAPEPLIVALAAVLGLALRAG